ncbi:hypothetical protein D1007_12795 [Hordeum vulgare]|nr:hypothetical protein D1007_12795 [Hordeum vulgare]
MRIRRYPKVIGGGGADHVIHDLIGEGGIHGEGDMSVEFQVNPSLNRIKRLLQYQLGMKFRVVCRKLYDYVRYDLKEIAFPSSLPDPPGTKRRPKLTLKEKWCILKEATRLYGALRDIGPELRPNDYKKAKEESEPSSSEEGKTKSEPTVLEDLAVAARGGAETLKPALRRI